MKTLALLAILGWTDLFQGWLQPTDPSDVRVHPHLADIGVPGQLGCDTDFAQFGEIGSTLRLWVHRNRCMTVGALLPQGTATIIVASAGYLDPPTYDPAAGWGWTDPAQTIGVFFGTPADAEGFSHVDIDIPDDPGLVGLKVYLQALALTDPVRESSGGELTIQ